MSYYLDREHIDFRIRNPYGDTLLHAAVASGDLMIVDLLLEKMPWEVQFEVLSMLGMLGDTPQQAAEIHGSFAIAERFAVQTAWLEAELFGGGAVAQNGQAPQSNVHTDSVPLPGSLVPDAPPLNWWEVEGAQNRRDSSMSFQQPQLEEFGQAAPQVMGASPIPAYESLLPVHPNPDPDALSWLEIEQLRRFGLEELTLRQLPTHADWSASLSDAPLMPPSTIPNSQATAWQELERANPTLGTRHGTPYTNAGQQAAANLTQSTGRLTSTGPIRANAMNPVPPIQNPSVQPSLPLPPLINRAALTASEIDQWQDVHRPANTAPPASGLNFSAHATASQPHQGSYARQR